MTRGVPLASPTMSACITQGPPPQATAHARVASGGDWLTQQQCLTAQLCGLATLLLRRHPRVPLGGEVTPSQWYYTVPQVTAVLYGTACDSGHLSRMAGGPLASPTLSDCHGYCPPNRVCGLGKCLLRDTLNSGQACLKAPRELVATLLGCLKELGRLGRPRTHRTGSQVSLPCTAGCYIQGYSDTKS